MTDTLSPPAATDTPAAEVADPVRNAAPGDAERERASRRSRLWRTVWRTHFYAGILVIPFIVMFAVTGLVILYTQPINDATRPDLLKVTPRATSVPLDTAVANGLVSAGRGWHVVSVITPTDAHHSVTLSLASTDKTRFKKVFVDPYTGRVLGTDHTDGLPGLANRLHRDLDIKKTIKVPSIATLFDHSKPVMASVAIGDLITELAAGWALVLAVSGLYLWWPRKRGTGKALFKPRLAKRGRARWRDLHAVPMAAFSVVLVWFVVTGMPWGAVWGSGWGAASTRIDAGTPFPDVASRLPNQGDLDRFGNPVAWALSRGSAIGATPQSTQTAVGAVAPPTMSYQQIAAVAQQIPMQPGYSITPPADTAATKDAKAVYGTYQLNSPWPNRLSKEQTVFLDQFSGNTIASYKSAQWGLPAKVTEFGVEGHMGIQLGLVNRILMTLGCLTIIWGAFAALVMWWKRRPKGTVGLPRRPVDVRRAKGLLAIAVVLGVLYPVLGVSMVAVGLADRYVIRRIRRLRVAFGMR